MSRLRFAIALSALTLVVGCDPIHPLRIYNRMPEPIFIAYDPPQSEVRVPEHRVEPGKSVFADEIDWSQRGAHSVLVARSSLGTCGLGGHLAHMGDATNAPWVLVSAEGAHLIRGPFEPSLAPSTPDPEAVLERLGEWWVRSPRSSDVAH